MADPCIWELGTRSGVLGHLRWVRQRDVVLCGPWRVHRMMAGWMLRHRLQDGVDADLSMVQGFVMDTLPERLPGLVPRLLTEREVPNRSRWLMSLDADRLPPMGTRDPYGWFSNRWPRELDESWILEHTERGSLRWSRGSHSGFKAGGRRRDGTEFWLSLVGMRRQTTLVLRDERGLWCPPIHQKSGWLRRNKLQRVASWLQGRV